MKISTNLLKAIAASVILGGVVTSCVSDKVSINPDVTCEADCDEDHNHKESSEGENPHTGDCPACGLG